SACMSRNVPAASRKAVTKESQAGEPTPPATAAGTRPMTTEVATTKSTGSAPIITVGTSSAVSTPRPATGTSSATATRGRTAEATQPAHAVAADRPIDVMVGA